MKEKKEEETTKEFVEVPSEPTLIELKAKVFDIDVQINQLNNLRNQIINRIAQLS